MGMETKNPLIVPQGDARYIKQDGSTPFQDDQSMGDHKLIDVVDPTENQDAATKAYVDIGLISETWIEVTATTYSMVSNRGYLANNGSRVVLTLPDEAEVGSVIKVLGAGSGGWRVSQRSGQKIHFNGMDTTTGAGGYLASTQRYGAIELICSVEDSEWVVRTVNGVITIE